MSDNSHLLAIQHQEIMTTEIIRQEPFTMYRPQLFKALSTKRGPCWCACYGKGIQDSVHGFGDSPAEAVTAFNAAWYEKLDKGAS